jgi:hypothetical protein
MRRLLLIGAPLVAVLTLMLGLRIGAGEAVHSAAIFAAPPTQGRVALQILTYYEERSVRETVAMKDLTLVATSNGGKKEARWKGDSNEDGIAEAVLVFDHDPVTTDGDLKDIQVELRVADEKEPLAQGSISFATTAWGRSDSSRAAARPTKRVGPIPIDVLVEGERLVPGFETSIWIHAPGAAAIDIEPEPGLEVQKTHLVPCDAGGWMEAVVIARAHVVGFKLDAKNDAGESEWYGPLPVAPGAFFVGMPRIVPEGKPTEVVLVAPNPRKVVYAEVDDTNGRTYAAASPVALDPGDAIPRAKITIPPLAKGLHWLVVSGEPRGAEKLAGAAVAKPFKVGAPQDACVVGPWLAERPAEGFPRTLALDGMAVRGATNAKRRRIGLLIGFLSLAAAALLDAILMIAMAREARAVTLLADLAEGEEPKILTAKPPGGSILVGVLVAILGFAFLAVLLFAKG